MMMLLDAVPLPWLLAAIFVATLLCVEAGYRAGRRAHAYSPHENESVVGAMAGGMLGLLAFMLAFTFGMAESRYDRRRLAVIEEATIIGTTYLRAQLLPEAQATTSLRLLREYIDIRIQAAQEPATYQRAVQRSEEIHGLLWSEVRAISASHVDSEIFALYVETLNEMIDMHLSRISAGVRARVPNGIWLGLGILTALSMVALGYQSGLVSERRSRAAGLLVLAFSIALSLIIDLDRPQKGLVRVGQQAMLDAQRSIHAGP